MDPLLSLDDTSPADLQKEMAKKLKSLRLSKNITQKTLHSMSGVTEISIKRFENSGEISLKALLRLAWALGALEAFKQVLPSSEAIVTARDLKAALKKKKDRKRGSK